MNSTLITLPAGDKRLAPPFDSLMEPATPWTFDMLGGAGAIHSSVADMLIFAKAALDPKSPIGPAMKTALSVRAAGANARIEQALGWQVRRGSIELLLHDGETWGYRSIIALLPSSGRAVVALANSRSDPAPADLALHVLVGSPVQQAPPLFGGRKAISLPTEALDKVVGRYDFGPGFIVAVTRDGGTVYAQREGIPGAVRAAIFPEAPLAFFWKIVDAQIRFTAEANGAVTGAELSQGGQTFSGKRLPP